MFPTKTNKPQQNFENYYLNSFLKANLKYNSWLCCKYCLISSIQKTLILATTQLLLLNSYYINQKIIQTINDQGSIIWT